MNQQVIKRIYQKVLLIIFIGLVGSMGSGVIAYHIPTSDEGLLTSEGCYVGAYLGGKSGFEQYPGCKLLCESSG